MIGSLALPSSRVSVVRSTTSGAIAASFVHQQQPPSGDAHIISNLSVHGLQCECLVQMRTMLEAGHILLTSSATLQEDQQQSLCHATF